MAGRFGFTVVLPPYAGAGQNESVAAPYVGRLEALGGTRLAPEHYDDPAPLAFLIATGGTEGATLALHERREACVPGEPVLLVAHAGNNSLPAAMEVLARLQQDGVPGRIVYVRGFGDAEGWDALERALHDADVRARLHATRIGLVGDPSDWLVASSPDPAIVAATWGPEVVGIAMDELASAMESTSAEEVEKAAASLSGEASGCVEPADADVGEAARVYAGLRAVVDERGLDAVTVRCFDIVMSRGTSGCFALSELTDAGAIAGCEGDLVSTVGMLWAKLMTGETPWMANPSDLDAGANALVLAHCTVPRTVVERYTLRSHFESGLGVGIAGTFPKGPVTLLRIGGAAMDELWLAEGEITETGSAENLCRTQVRVELSVGNVGDLLTAPLGNHIVMVRGSHGIRLAEWWETML